MRVWVKDGFFYLKKKLRKGESFKVSDDAVIFMRKAEMVIGISSMCEDRKHVLFADFDNIVRWLMLEDLKDAIKEFNLGPVYILKTKEEEKQGEVMGNYHAICLTKMSVEDVAKILSKMHCDANYKTMPLRNRYKCWVLRTSSKGRRCHPVFDTVLNGDTGREISSAHLKFLKDVYQVPDLHYSNSDGLEGLYRHVYETRNV